MKLGLLMVTVVTMTACGASYPVPTQRMADAQSAHRSAQELGADKHPAAQLHLNLAAEQIAKATAVLKEEDNRRADFMLIRAKADAELALAIAHGEKSKEEAQQALEQSNTQAANNLKQGAQR
jgi:hypothetical protein